MIIKTDGVVIIECDKCHTKVEGTDETYNQVAWDVGFALNNGRKYEHLCYDCLPRKKQKSMDFAHKHFTF